MNLAHRWLCNSRIWRKAVQTHILPWALEDVQLGAKVLELGPGPGVTTACLRGLAADLTCIEIDPKYASSLGHRMASNGVRVVAGDGAAMPLADAIFDTAVCFTMLHHVPSMVLQDRLLREVMRVLRPEGIFLGTDSVTSRPFRLFHLFDTIVPVDPHNFSDRLRAAGFANIQVDVRGHDFRFRAHKPAIKGDQTG
jgi:SAM-dependent methyltransferase